MTTPLPSKPSPGSVGEPPHRLAGHSRAIVKALLLGGSRSRAELATELDLSAGSLTRLTKPLFTAGLIVEQPLSDPQPGLGRPSIPLIFNHSAFRFVGIKLTKTHAFGALTQANAHIEHQHQVELGDQSPNAALRAITEIVSVLVPLSPVPITAIGITLGGHVDQFRTVTHADHLGWDHVPLADLVEQATGIMTVVENDIVAHTQATEWFGEGANTDSFALVTLGAGIGYGLVANGQMVVSPEAGYSLLSHFPLLSQRLLEYGADLAASCPNLPNPLSFTCGHLGCATALLTLAGLEDRGTKALGREVTYPQLLALASGGDPVARLFLDASGYALGTALASIANLTLAPRIVLGGEASELAQVAHTALLAGLHEHRDPRTADPEIRFQAPDLTLWARGAAVVAMHSAVLGRD